MRICLHNTHTVISDHYQPQARPFGNTDDTSSISDSRKRPYHNHIDSRVRVRHAHKDMQTRQGRRVAQLRSPRASLQIDRITTSIAPFRANRPASSYCTLRYVLSYCTLRLWYQEDTRALSSTREHRRGFPTLL